MTIAGTPVITRQGVLFDLLACPQCHARLATLGSTSVAGLLWNAELRCEKCEERVGVVLESKPSFLERDFGAFDAKSTTFKVDTTDALVPTGHWTSIGEGQISMGSTSDALSLDTSCQAMAVTFHTHDWSGEVDVVADGALIEHRDLYSPGPGDITMSIPFDSLAAHHLEIRPAGSRNHLSNGEQVIVKAVHAWVAEADLAVPDFGPVDRGNPYPPYFLELLNALPAAAVALDAGGGDRQVGDKRLFNLEYLPYTAPDVYGDGLCLPFQDDAFDLILSQAVLEHVPDPQRAVDELHRILKPGGTMYVEIAFTQPLHAVPSHYFNVTPFGAEHLFRAWRSANVSWFGGVADTLIWWSNLVNLPAKWPAEKMAAFTSLLTDFDSAISYDELKFFASGVAVTAKK